MTHDGNDSIGERIVMRAYTKQWNTLTERPFKCQFPNIYEK